MLVPILLTLLGKQRLQAFVETHKRSSPGRMLSTGLLTGLILGTASLLLLLTVVGIPFILVLGIYPLVSFALGFTVLSHWLGEQIRAASYRSSWIRAAAGALILTSALNLPLLGGVLLVGILLFSLGITTVWILSHRK
ncbi:hypothetical protein N6H14_21295 [Paenibacillus sp. CC-CFT747]|nr:hypothetical protein N6H14_21295 [Paenibacillus sp. CC-CFT747]